MQERLVACPLQRLPKHAGFQKIRHLLMKHEGPPLEVLLRRLAETPEEFLSTPRIAGRGTVQVDAIMADLVRSLGGVPAPDQIAPFRPATPKDRNRLSVALLLAWMLADDWFRARRDLPAKVLAAIAEAAAELASAAAPVFTRDPDRREEMARLALARLDFRPAGETIPQAQDRLKSISAAERTRVINAARAAEKRARDIRKALAKKAAEESADKYTRE